MAHQHNRKAAKGRPQATKPITSHQLFPAVVALWFGALFGLGSLAIRPGLLEAVVMKSRIDLIVPAAAPPLGITARMLIALAMAAIGAALGILVARRLVHPKVELRPRKRGARGQDNEAELASHRPVYGAADLAEAESGAGEEPAGLLVGRRRGALAIEPDAIDFVPHEMAPLPGGTPQVLDISGIDLPDHAPLPGHEPPRHEPVDAAAPLDLGSFAQPARQIFGMSVENDQVDQCQLRPAGFKTSAFDTEAPEPLFTARPLAAVQGECEPAAPAPVAEVVMPVPQPPVASLGMTDLASRLQQSMQRRRAARSAAPVLPEPHPLAHPAPEPVVAAIPAPFAAPLADGTALLSPTPPFAKPDPAAVVPPAPLAMPAALRPLDLADRELEGEEHMLASLLPPRHIVTPAAQPLPEVREAVQADQPEAADEPAEPAEEESYASLLDIGQPLAARAQFVRIEEPEVGRAEVEPLVIFPGQAPFSVPDATPPFRRFDAPSTADQGGMVATLGAPQTADPTEADQALRTALANLQRMSGVA